MLPEYLDIIGENEMKKVLIFFLLLMLSACQKNVLSLSDNGKSMAFKVGKSFEIQLPENPTTGYQWNLIFSPQDQMIVVPMSEEYIPEPVNRVGAGGVRILKYLAYSSGTVIIYGSQIRPWENAKAKAPTLKFTITVE